MTANDCLECAELLEQIFRLQQALTPFVIRGAGLVFDTRRDGAIIIRCRHCSAWTGGSLDDFKHDSSCIISKGAAILRESQRI